MTQQINIYRLTSDKDKQNWKKLVHFLLHNNINRKNLTNIFKVYDDGVRSAQFYGAFQ